MTFVCLCLSSLYGIITHIDYDFIFFSFFFLVEIISFFINESECDMRFW